MINFPSSPTVNQQFTAAGATWIWDGVKWGPTGSSTAYLPQAGGTMTGPLVLAADPTTAMQATTKEYTDVAPSAEKNYIDNALFRVQQRGVGPWTTSNGTFYTADRWAYVSGPNGSRNISINTIGDSGRAAIGDEEAEWGLGYSFTGGSAAGDADELIHRIEDIKRLSGKTVTLSFWAFASTALTIGFNVNQNFGSGGSPSPVASIWTTGQTFALTTSWARYSLTFVVPSAAGKTFGTTAWTDYTALFFYLSAGSGAQPGSGIGVQSGAVTFWGMQLQVSPTVGPLEKIPMATDVVRCQRFYEQTTGGFLTTGYLNTSGAIALSSLPFKVLKRATPVGTIIGTPTYTNCSALSLASTNVNIVNPTVTVTAAGEFNCSWSGGFSADL